MDGGGFQRFGFVGVGQQPRQARGQQGLAAAGWADEEQCVGAGGSNFQRAPRSGLSAHVGQVRVSGRCQRQIIDARQRQRRFAAQVRTNLQQGARDVRAAAAGQSGFGAVAGGHHQWPAFPRCGQGGRQHAVHRLQFPGKRQLAQQFDFAQGLHRYLAAGRQ